MTAGRGLILLDTNVVIEVIRNRATGQKIVAEWDLLNRPERPLVSLISLGEALGLAEQWKWGPEKRHRLRELFGELVLVDLSFGRIPECYGEISSFSRAGGLNLSENDMWIAATTMETKAHLLTLDHDFGPLGPRFIELTVVGR